MILVSCLTWDNELNFFLLFSFMFYIFILIGGLFYNIVMAFAIRQHELAIGIHVFPPSWPLPPSPPAPYPSRLSQSTSSGCSASCIELALVIYFTYANLYVSMLFSKSSHPHFSPLSPKGYSIQLCLLCCPACRLISPIFLNSIYMVCPWNSPGKNTEVVCHSLLQEIFLTQGSDLGLLYCRQIFYHLSYRGSPYMCVNIQYLSFTSLTYFTLYDRHQVHPPH